MIQQGGCGCLSGFLAIPASDLQPRGFGGVASLVGRLTYRCTYPWRRLLAPLKLADAWLGFDLLWHSGTAASPLSFRSTEQRAFELQDLMSSKRQLLLYSGSGFRVWGYHWPRRRIGEAERRRSPSWEIMPQFGPSRLASSSSRLALLEWPLWLVSCGK